MSNIWNHIFPRRTLEQVIKDQDESLRNARDDIQALQMFANDALSHPYWENHKGVDKIDGHLSNILGKLDEAIGDNV